MEAISHAGAAVGVLSKEGVVLAAEKKIMSKVCTLNLSRSYTREKSESVLVSLETMNLERKTIVRRFWKLLDIMQTTVPQSISTFNVYAFWCA